jgi:ATP-binding cassette subfamily B multidrug efflux pump
MIKLLRYLRPYRTAVAIVFVLVFFQSLASLYLPRLMTDIMSSGITKGDTDYIKQVGGLMLLVSLGSIVCSVAAAFFSARTSISFGRDVRRNIFTRVEQFSLHEFDTVSTSSLITRTTNDTVQVQQVFLMIMRMMIMAPMMCIGGTIMAINEDAQLSWVLVAIIPVLIITIVVIMAQAVPLFQSMQKKIDKLNLILGEGLAGVRVIRAFDRTEHEKQRFDAANLDLTNVAIQVNRIVAVMMPIMMLVMSGTSIAIIWFGSIRVDNGMDVAKIGAFTQYAMQILFSLLMVSFLFIMIPRAEASATRINEVLAIEPEIKDIEQTKQSGSQKGFVEFKDVTFSYPGAEEPAISNISFQATPGHVTAIIGGTGAGKSTLINLIPRFYDIDSGSILVDGVDIREMSQENLRSKIGFVPQKAVLFSGTITENIQYGKQSADSDEMDHAADVAQATEFIKEMTEGFDTAIAQGGTNVSGGQKQRLSIARALIRKPEIYIFDDSFSALDFKTDAKLRAALRPEIANSTVFIVAQRVGTVMDADQIIVLDEGKIAGIGTHRELMKTSLTYREIVSSQLAEEEIA